LHWQFNTCLREFDNLEHHFILEEAAIALYEKVGYANYLNVILRRISQNSQAKN